MTALSKVMRAKNIKYFSQLTAKQKDKASNFYLYVRLNILDIDIGLRQAIIRGYDIEKIFSMREELTGCKMFYFAKSEVWLPLNIEELLKKGKTNDLSNERPER